MVSKVLYLGNHGHDEGLEPHAGISKDVIIMVLRSLLPRAISNTQKDPLLAIVFYQCSRKRGKVEPPKTNNDRKTNNMYHMHTLGASKCMHVVHSVGFAIAVGFNGSTLFREHYRVLPAVVSFICGKE